MRKCVHTFVHLCSCLHSAHVGVYMCVCVSGCVCVSESVGSGWRQLFLAEHERRITKRGDEGGF